MTLTELNTLNETDAKDWFSQACAASRWVNKMVAARPFNDQNMLFDRATSAWSEMREPDYLEAFDAHPMIGDLNSLRKKYQSTLETAGSEQSGTSAASQETLVALQDLNHRYRDNNGFIFIICASGLSAEHMLKALTMRINNSREEELNIAAQQQFKITELRLTKQLTQSTRQ